jgi:homoserine/homoserine lactone efflux protein
MPLDTWITFFAASWAISISPGAGAVAAMTAGLQHGFARGYFLTFGLILGLWSQLLLVGAGLGALIVASATAFALVKWLGVAYLLWLGISQWRAPAVGVHAESGGTTVASRRSILARGWALNSVNPKGTLPPWRSPTSSSTRATPRSRRRRWRRCARRARCAG